MTYHVCLFLAVWLVTGLALGQPLKGGIPATLPSLYVTSQGRLAGAHGDVEFIGCFVKRLQQNIHWQSYPTARLIEETKNNKIDIIFPMGFTTERRALLIESQPVQVIEDYWVYKDEISDTTNKHLRLGVKLGSPQDSYLQRQGYQNILRHNDYAGLFKMLLVNRVEMVALPDVVYNSLIASAENRALKHTAYLKRGYGFYLKPAATDAFLQSVNDSTVKCRPKAGE
jgi:ABC-type amino acid transport substrate-binding protein